MRYKRAEEQGGCEEVRMPIALMARRGGPVKYGRQELLQAIGCLLCAAVAWKHQIDLDGSEFAGGRLTGPLLTMNNIGTVLFALALLLVFLHSRTAAVSALAASVLCVPLYVSLAVPRLLRQVLPGEYSVPLQAFGWDRWSIAGILLIASVVYFCYRALLPRRNGGAVRAGTGKRDGRERP